MQVEGFEILVTCSYCNIHSQDTSLLGSVTLYEQLLDCINLSRAAHILADFTPHNRCRDLSVFLCSHEGLPKLQLLLPQVQK